MDIDKLIERLYNRASRPRLKMPVDAFTSTGVYTKDTLDKEAADALSMLQAENEKLRAEADGMRSNWYKAVEEVKKLRAELEQVKAERDAAVNEVERVIERYVLLGPFDRLRELAQVDREGRCVVSPASIGDTVYHITTCKNFPQVLDGTMYGPNGGLGTATGLYCPCELAENCPFPCDDDGSFDCEKHKNTIAIFEDVVAGVFIEDMQDVITFGYSGSADFEDFGKTVFLTRAEAEEALRREQDEQIKP